MKLKSNKGFSLVELIIVIAIMGVIAGVAVPNLIAVQKNSNLSADVRTAEEIGAVVRTWLLEDVSTEESRAREAFLRDRVVELKQMDTKNFGSSASDTNAKKIKKGIENLIALNYVPNFEIDSSAYNATTDDYDSSAFYVGYINKKVVVYVGSVDKDKEVSKFNVFTKDVIDSEKQSFMYRLDDDLDARAGFAYVADVGELTDENISTVLGISLR